MIIEKKPKIILAQSLVGCLLIFSFGVHLLMKSYKDKTDLDSVTGQIEYIDKEHEGKKMRHEGNFRFIELADIPYVIAIFVGKDTLVASALNLKN